MKKSELRNHLEWSCRGSEAISQLVLVRTRHLDDAQFPCYGILDFNNCPTSTTLPNGQPAVDLSGLTADQEFQAGMFCGSVKHRRSRRSRLRVRLGSMAPTWCKSPRRTPRTTTTTLHELPRVVCSIWAIGDDNLFKTDKYKWSAQLTIINLTNNYALYNFLSTFSGTHYVTPRAITVQIGFHF